MLAKTCCGDYAVNIMAWTVIKLYKDVLPKTNCGDCAQPTCLAFASRVVLDQYPLSDCPHIDASKLESLQAQLDTQHKSGRHTRRDIQSDALAWAKNQAASMEIEDLPQRIGGILTDQGGRLTLELPYFNQTIHITQDGLSYPNGNPLAQWEQVFVYNHMAQGGRSNPTGIWKGLELIPNTTPKLMSMREHVEKPLIKRFSTRSDELVMAARVLGGRVIKDQEQSADLAILFRPLPKVPIMLLFWDADIAEGFEARTKLLFDQNITEHLDIESIMFLSERLRQLLCNDPDRH